MIDVHPLSCHPSYFLLYGFPFSFFCPLCLPPCQFLIRVQYIYPPTNVAYMFFSSLLISILDHFPFSTIVRLLNVPPGVRFLLLFVWFSSGEEAGYLCGKEERYGWDGGGR